MNCNLFIDYLSQVPIMVVTFNFVNESNKNKARAIKMLIMAQN